MSGFSLGGIFGSSAPTLSNGYLMSVGPNSLADTGGLSVDQLRSGAGILPASAGPAGLLSGGSGGGIFGLNNGELQLGAGVLGGIANIWSAMQASDLAKKQFGFTQRFANANLSNQISTYNTALGDRARSRFAAENRSDAEREAYLSANRLAPTRV